jgi:hypothetical protein
VPQHGERRFELVREKLDACAGRAAGRAERLVPRPRPANAVEPPARTDRARLATCRDWPWSIEGYEQRAEGEIRRRGRSQAESFAVREAFRPHDRAARGACEQAIACAPAGAGRACRRRHLIG